MTETPERRSWPVHYRVTLHMREGPPRQRDVVTWLHPEKAVALAVLSHARDDAQTPIYDVQVEEIGPADRSDDGTVAIGKGYLFDRWEF